LKTALEAKTFYRKTEHTDELRGFGDLYIWFGGLLNKSVQGLIICHPLFPTITRLLLAPVAIQPGSNFFSLFMWALGNYCFVQMSSSIFSCTVFLYKVFDSRAYLGRLKERTWSVHSLERGHQISLSTDGTALPRDCTLSHLSGVSI
jgi:hypothetical protein